MKSGDVLTQDWMKSGDELINDKMNIPQVIKDNVHLWKQINIPGIIVLSLVNYIIIIIIH